MMRSNKDYGGLEVRAVDESKEMYWAPWGIRNIKVEGKWRENAGRLGALRGETQGAKGRGRSERGERAVQSEDKWKECGPKVG